MFFLFYSTQSKHDMMTVYLIGNFVAEYGVNEILD